MRHLRVIPTLAVGLLLCSSAEASNPPEFQELPLAFVLSGSCAGREDIAITGTEYIQFQQFIDAKGGLHFSYLFGFRGDAAGVGLTSGVRYRLVGSAVGAEFNSSSLPVTLTHQIRFSFVGPGPANNIQAFETANIKVNANGEVTVYITEVATKCPD